MFVGALSDNCDRLLPVKNITSHMPAMDCLVVALISGNSTKPGSSYYASIKAVLLLFTYRNASPKSQDPERTDRTL